MAKRAPVCLLLVLWLGALALGPASDAGAQAYTWEDDRGRRHFTDNPGAVPARYRSQIEERDMPVLPTARGSAAPASDRGEPSEFTREFLDEIFAQLDEQRRGAQQPALTRQQKQRMEGWATTWLVPLIVSSVLSFVLGIGIVIHGFATGHIGWALANLFLYVTQPFYVMLHVFEENVGPRIILLVLVLVPIGVSILATRGLIDIVRLLAT